MSYLTDGTVRKKISQALEGFLADSAVLYMKTHAFHWNVEGAHFHSLHTLFEEQYKDLWESLDEIAERMRALGEKTPCSLAGLLKAAEMKEAGDASHETQMLEELRDCNMLLALKAQKVAALAETHEDRGTADLLTERGRQFEKNAWMLNSSLQHEGKTK